MRTLSLLLSLTACGQLHPFDTYYGDTADTQDTGFDDSGDTGTDTAIDTGRDTGHQDTSPPPTIDGSYTGTFSMEVTALGIIPIDSCTGAATAFVSGGSMQGSFTCTFTSILGALGTQNGEMSATTTGGTLTSPYATLGLFFTFDELTGSFSSANAFRMTEVGTANLELGDYDYSVSFDLQK